MATELRNECDRLQQMLGARNERIRQLERELVEQRRHSQESAREWVRLIDYQKELADWLIESTTNEGGMVVRHRMDAGLAGELFIPCAFFKESNGRRYRLELVSTEYEIKEVGGDG